MKKYICKNCNLTFEYCRGCLLSPIPYKEAGYCSKTCYEASKNKVVSEVISTDDVAPIVEEESIDIEAETIVEETAPVEIEAEVETLIEVPTKTITVVEPTIKQETYNAYKKKKKKHR